MTNRKKSMTLVWQLALINLVVFIFTCPHADFLKIGSMLGACLSEPDSQVWRYVTYSFLHSGLLHFLFNMIVLVSFGAELEGLIGRVRFFFLFMVSSVFSALFWQIFSINPEGAYLIGASGAICGIIAAMATLSKKSECYFLIIKMKTRNLVCLFAIYSLFAHIFDTSNVAHLAHLGGIISGFAYSKIFLRKFENKLDP
jgi:membrane associated rhomboid family serine protease